MTAIETLCTVLWLIAVAAAARDRVRRRRRRLTWKRDLVS